MQAFCAKFLRIKAKRIDFGKRYKTKSRAVKKNTAIKIQQAQIKEQKYQQDLEFQKKNNPKF